MEINGDTVISRLKIFIVILLSSIIIPQQTYQVQKNLDNCKISLPPTRYIDNFKIKQSALIHFVEWKNNTFNDYKKITLFNKMIYSFIDNLIVSFLLSLFIEHTSFPPPYLYHDVYLKGLVQFYSNFKRQRWKTTFYCEYLVSLKV